MQSDRNWLSPDYGVGWLAFSALSCMLAIVVAVLLINEEMRAQRAGKAAAAAVMEIGRGVSP